MSSRRILFISPRQCWPPLSGAKLREYYFLRALAQDARITYLYFAETEQDLSAQLSFCETVAAVPKPHTYGTWNLVKGALGRLPLPILNYSSPAMSRVLAQQKGPFDLLHLDSIHMVRYGAPAGRVVYNWHNIESEAMQRYGDSIASPARRVYARLTTRKLRRLEREILQTSLGHVVCSERERKQLEEIAPAARIVAVENGVDTEYFASARAAVATRRRLLFVGKMDYHPNVDAVKHFAASVWPSLSKQWPEWTLTIAGSDPVEAVQALAGSRNVEVTGTVADLRPYYREAVAAIVPLRTGGGTRLKILEAMAAGVPVISTRLGAEGLSVEPDRNILLADADQPADWIAQLQRVHAQPEQWRSLAERGLELVKARYDWSICGEALRRTYNDWLRSIE